MKKNVLVIAGLALVSTSAFASKARIESFGNNAKLYIKDQRNIFRNAATVNSNTNMIVTEWGKSQSSDFDKDVAGSTPRAEGGFFRQAGSLNYGLYLGNNATDDRTVPSTTDAGYLTQDNALDLFIGGDAGLQWGARVHYANSKNEMGAGQEMKNNAMGVGAGIVMGQLEVYTNVTIADKSEGTAELDANGNYTNFAAGEFKKKPSFDVGASYDLNGTIVFAEVSMNKAEEGTVTHKDNSYLLGAGRVMELTPTARVFGNVAFEYSKKDIAGTDTKGMTLPVAFGFEADATSWLTLRGSVGQNVVLNNTKSTTAGVETKSTNANTTNVTAGASLTFGKLALDGYVGTQATGKLDADNLFSRVGVTYNF